MSHVLLDADNSPGHRDRPPALDLRANALFIDLDGTLIDIEPSPDQVASDPALRALLRDLVTQSGGAIAIISGRSVGDVDRILHETVPMVSGLHGQEVRDGRDMNSLDGDDNLRAAAAMARAFMADFAAPVLLEEKGGGLALHYRRAPEHAELVRRAADEIAARHHLKVLHGKMVAEIVPHHASKGRAVTSLMQGAPFAGRAPIAIGDDTTDEDAFAAANELGGYAILVGAPRPTLAAYRLPGVIALRSWLLAGLGRSPK